MSDSTAITITRHLPVKLDSYRKQALHDLAHAEFIEQERLAIHLKNVTDSIKGMIKVSYKKQADANHDIKNGFETVPVVCHEDVDLATNTVNIIRDDTGLIVETCALEPREREKLVKPPSKPREAHDVRV